MGWLVGLVMKYGGCADEYLIIQLNRSMVIIIIIREKCPSVRMP